MAALRRLRLFIVSTVLQCGPKYIASDTVSLCLYSLLISVEFHLIHTLIFLPNFIKVRHLVTQQSVHITVNLLCRLTHYCSAGKKGRR